MSFYSKDVHRALESFYHSDKGKEASTLEMPLESFHYSCILLVMESYYALKTVKDMRVAPIGYELQNLTEYLRKHLGNYALMEFTELKLDAYTKLFLAFNDSMGVEVDTSDDYELFELLKLCYPLTIDVKIQQPDILEYWNFYLETYVDVDDSHAK